MHDAVRDGWREPARPGPASGSARPVHHRPQGMERCAGTFLQPRIQAVEDCQQPGPFRSAASPRRSGHADDRFRVRATCAGTPAHRSEGGRRRHRGRRDSSAEDWHGRLPGRGQDAPCNVREIAFGAALLKAGPNVITHAPCRCGAVRAFRSRVAGPIGAGEHDAGPGDVRRAAARRAGGREMTPAGIVAMLRVPQRPAPARRATASAGWPRRRSRPRGRDRGSRPARGRLPRARQSPRRRRRRAPR